ncbi:hypothetical protein CISG_01310 [Coccidioides immitis RMSCC 3703]|uniref:Uncharacterized protein n=1 Tax=Coccidioides immitis RMSCC 3703 TaxID=454286 RepID=A0A0J8TUP1_COCIT|nr:hypothetical protein CISG_01310 [Coccidioides immitis RMSCC 3703]
MGMEERQSYEGGHSKIIGSVANQAQLAGWRVQLKESWVQASFHFKGQIYACRKDDPGKYKPRMCVRNAIPIFGIQKHWSFGSESSIAGHEARNHNPERGQMGSGPEEA